MFRSAKALAFSNIAFIKYWGDKDPHLHIPANSSLSMNLAGLHTRTQVSFLPDLPTDSLTMDGKAAYGEPLHRVRAMLERVRQMAGLDSFASVESANNFPTGTGIASSASAFAALSLAASTAAGLRLGERELSRLARTGSGSACRSIPGGFVEWQAGSRDHDSYAYSIAPPEHWDLVDCVVILSEVHKPVGSSEGHGLADSSPLQPARVASAQARLDMCRRALLERDFEALADVIELDSNMMHAVMMTSAPPLIYWQPSTLDVLHSVIELRRGGTPACYTVDAGPNVHVICLASYADQLVSHLSAIPGVIHVLTALPGGAARLE